MKKFFIISMVALLAFIFQSHEFWMNTSDYRPMQGEEILINVLVGENFEGEPWNWRASRITSAMMFSEGDKIDIQEIANPGEEANLVVQFDNPGTKLISLQTNNAFITLDQNKFDEYLKEDGITDILNQRQGASKEKDSVSEVYMRSAKVLLKVEKESEEDEEAKDPDEKESSDETATMITGLELELVPVRDPYSLAVGNVVEFRLIRRDNPLSNRMVRLWHKSEDGLKKVNLFTNEEGIISFILKEGDYMISSVYMEPVEKTDYQSYWTTFVFGGIR